ncbi:MAG: hypothetical protein QOE65_582 [Solirubrobacteraceae bacterium]|nr:hypothetical protein [Solirubrobacteraceae bacterium]
MEAASHTAVGPGPVPELGFAVLGASALEHSAVPTIRFDLGLESLAGQEIRSVMLNVQLQIAARRRPYEPAAQRRLVELFGTPERWGSTLSTLPWLRTTVAVPPFTGSVAIALDVPCTYDLEVKASRYLNALEEGTVPLELLFSGSVFYAGAGGALQTAMIGWDKEAAFDMPVGVWRETMDQHFRGTAWLRIGRETYDRLNDRRSRSQHSSWDETLDELLGEGPG